MNINDDGAEIDSADQLTVYGEWIKFVDGEGSTVKIPPFVVKKLLVFALDHIKEFEEGAWDEEDPTLLEVTPAQMAHADALRRENEWLKDDLHDAARILLAAERKPLTDEEIDRVTDQQWTQNNHNPIYAAHRAYARAIERAHGIGEQHGS